VKRTLRIFIGIVLAVLVVNTLSAQTRTLRIAAYNIEDDIDGATTPLAGLIAPYNNSPDVGEGGTVEGMGEETVAGDSAQPLDILALEETTSNPTTVSPICNGMNIFYNMPGMYTNSNYQGTESGGDTGDGNGPNAVVYNTLTVQLVTSVPVDPAGGTSKLGGVSSGDSGEYREVMRYEFAPAGVTPTPANEFYIYVSHYKSGSSSTANNYESRAGEATIIRSNMMTTLPAGARILHVGDFNTGETSEEMYGILIAPGTNQLIDPLNTNNSLNIAFDGSGYPADLTEEDYDLQYRDDYQMMTTNVYYDVPGGLTYVPGTYHPFGNNGTTPYKGSVISGSDTALNNDLSQDGQVFISASTLYEDLNGASDHLPIVADYTIPLPVPTIASVSAAGANLSFSAANCVTGEVYTVLMATNLPVSSWTPVATNVSPGTAFSFTLTNAINSTASQQFYQLQMP
jgi:hypothetical protein